MEVKFIQNFDHLSHYSECWNKMTFAAPQGTPELSYAWVSAYLRHCVSPGKSWICMMALDREQVLGILPIIVPDASISSPRLRTPNDLQTQSVDILTKPENRAEIIGSMLDMLDKVAPDWFQMEFIRLPENSPTLQFAKGPSRKYHFIPDLNGWAGYIRLEHDYEKFFSGLGARFRRNLRSSQRKLEMLADFQALRITSQKADDSHFEAFIEMESSGWKGRKGTSIRDSETNLAFYRTLVHNLAECGCLEWYFLKARGKFIASALTINCQGVLHIPKIAYDEDFALYSPGQQIVRQMIEWACGEKSWEIINFMTDAEWLASWQVQKRACYDLKIFPRRMRPVLMGVLPLQAKTFLQKVPGLRPLVRTAKGIIRRN